MERSGSLRSGAVSDTGRVIAALLLASGSHLLLAASLAAPSAMWGGALLAVAGALLLVGPVLRAIEARGAASPWTRRLMLATGAGLGGTLASRLGTVPWANRELLATLGAPTATYGPVAGFLAAAGAVEALSGALLVVGLAALFRRHLSPRFPGPFPLILVVGVALYSGVAAGRALILLGAVPSLDALRAGGDLVALVALLYPTMAQMQQVTLLGPIPELLLALLLVPAWLATRARGSEGDEARGPDTVPAPPAAAPAAPAHRRLIALFVEIPPRFVISAAFLAGLIAVIVFWAGTSDLLQGLFMGSIYALVALGYTMVYGVLKMINFAHGDVFMWGAFWLYLFAVRFGVNFFAACFAAALLCAVMGVLIERIAYRPLRRASRLAPLITAIGVSLFLEAAAQLSFGTGTKAVVPGDSPYSRFALGTSGFNVFGERVTLFHLDLWIVAVTIAIMVTLHVIVKHTKIGKAMRAVADDIDSARAVGIDVNRVISTTFAIGSFFAAIGGILFALRFAADPYMGIMPGIKAFTAAVVGGIGNVHGAMVGGVLLGLAEFVGAWGLGNAGVPFATSYRDAIAFIILIIVLLIRPSGLFGREHLTLSRRK